jgi:hypothetical protein
MSLVNVAPHHHADIKAAIARANESLPADQQITLAGQKAVTVAAFEQKKSWSMRYAEALASAGWALNLSAAEVLRLENARLKKTMNVAAIEFEFADFLRSMNYHPSPDAFEKLRVSILADVLRQLPRVGGGLLQ